MDSQPLTGRDAVEAISLAARLGNQNARFDRRRLNVALRTRAGRVRIMLGLALRAFVPFHVETLRGRAPRRAPRHAVRSARGAPASERPRPSTDPRERENGS